MLGGLPRYTVNSSANMPVSIFDSMKKVIFLQQNITYPFYMNLFSCPGVKNTFFLLSL
jgi:hypothetical protein